MYVKTFTKAADLQKHLLSVCVLMSLREKGNTDLTRCVVVLLHFKADIYQVSEQTIYIDFKEVPDREVGIGKSQVIPGFHDMFSPPKTSDFANFYPDNLSG